MNENKQLAVFRVKAGALLANYADRIKIFIGENVAVGMSKEAIRKIRQDPLSRWAMEREKLIKDMKREVAGLINRIHMAAYTKGL